jgi:hypothetical protein
MPEPTIAMRSGLHRAAGMSASHGQDAAYAMHSPRTAHQGIEPLTTGRFTLPVAEPERQRLMQGRRGAIALSDILDRLSARADG